MDRSVETIIEFVRGRAVRVLAREIDRDRVPGGVGLVSDRAFVAGVDVVVALGGDGTMLGAMRLMVDRPVPVLGVNYGNLGFLVEVTPDRLPLALARLTAGDFTIEQHGCLEVDAAGAEIGTRFGFNDVVLGRPDRIGAVSVDLVVNDLRYGYYRSDAVVVSTPTGSTAYNYAAGGPILSPSSDAVVITPVAPMSGISRPVVLGAQDRVRFTVAADSVSVVVDVDGAPVGELGHGDLLTAAMRLEAAQVVRFSTEEHASRNRIKLSLLDLPLRPDQLLELIPPELRRDAESFRDGEPDPAPGSGDMAEGDTRD
ncbi:NAD(+)/NADH kinase [Actinocorallia aurantiaca]|uniref:NAD kinase n=1 Tax=Actinocorallia aurantiaca TaxID=46204 RepID=A0ABP6HB50_9ACTN